MNMRALILAATALSLAGCQSTGGEVTELDQQAQLLAAVPSNYRQTIPLELRASIPDPSAILNAGITAPFLGSAGAGEAAPLVCVRLQLAGGAGTAPGVQTVAFVFADGRVVDRQWNSPACTNSSYLAFPELGAAPRPPAA